MERNGHTGLQARWDWSHVRAPQRARRQAAYCLQNSPYAILRGVSCMYDRGILLLRGQVPSFYHKQLAQETVRKIEGVVQVVHQIEVVAHRPMVRHNDNAGAASWEEELN